MSLFIQPPHLQNFIVCPSLLHCIVSANNFPNSVYLLVNLTLVTPINQTITAKLFNDKD